MLFIEFVEHMSDNSWIFSPTGTYRNFITSLEQLVVDDSLMHLIFEAGKEALLTDRLQIFRSLDEGFVGFADLTYKLRHWCFFPCNLFGYRMWNLGVWEKIC